ncbi:unnamed protein product [Brassica oleracea]
MTPFASLTDNFVTLDCKITSLVASLYNSNNIYNNTCLYQRKK